MSDVCNPSRAACTALRLGVALPSAGMEGGLPAPEPADDFVEAVNMRRGSLGGATRTYEGQRTKRLRKSNEEQKQRPREAPQLSPMKAFCTLPGSHAKAALRAAAGKDEAELPTRTDDEVRAEWKLQAVLFLTAHSEVELVQHARHGELRVLKRINKVHFESFQRRRASQHVSLQTEVKMLASLKHEGIVRMYCAFETQEHINILIEYCPGGDLCTHICKAGHFSEPSGRLLFLELCRALAYLHSEGVVHRDMKPENVLLTSKDRSFMRPKLADFGISRFCASRAGCRTYCGTRSYTAPEVVRQGFRRWAGYQQQRGKRGLVEVGDKENQALGSGEGYGKPADVWSLGVVLYVLLCGVPPFDAEEDPDTLHIHIMEGRFEFDVPAWASVSEAAKVLVKRLMSVEPSERPDVVQVLRDAWLEPT